MIMSVGLQGTDGCWVTVVRNLSNSAGNDETCRGDNSRHPAASWLARGGRGSPKARESPIAEAERQFLNAMAFQPRRWLV